MDNQRQYVVTVFRERGVVDAREMLNFGITRLADIIWKLRREWGADAIRTEPTERGRMATYTLVRRPEVWEAPRKQAKAKGWTCNTCGQRTLMVDERLSPTLGRSECDTCGKTTMFRLR